MQPVGLRGLATLLTRVGARETQRALQWSAGEPGGGGGGGGVVAGGGGRGDTPFAVVPVLTAELFLFLNWALFCCSPFHFRTETSSDETISDQ